MQGVPTAAPAAPICFVYVEERCANVDCNALGLIREQFAAALQSAPRPRIVVDLQEAGVFGSALISLLLQAIHQVRALGGELAVVGPRGDARQVVRITRLDKVWPVLETTEAAIPTGRLLRQTRS